MSQSSEHGTSSGGLNTGGNLSESSFLFLVPQISQNSTDFCPMRAGISQMLQMTQIFWQQITKSLCEEYKERSLKEKAQPGDVTSVSWANKKEKD